MSAETPDIMDPRIARARAMREAGAETAEIARACGVTVSTIYRWAEAHGFRVCDLEAAAWDASGRGLGSNISAFGLDPEAHATDPTGYGSPDQVRGPRGERETEDAPEITAEQWGQMARTLKQRALALTEAGRLRQAEQALRLAERYDRMRASAPQPKTNDGVDYHALLEEKLSRLHEHYMKQQDEAG